MRRVLMNTLAAGPEGVLPAGAVVDLPDDQAQQLLDGGYATDLAQPHAASVEDPGAGNAGAGDAGAGEAGKPAETATTGPDGTTSALTGEAATAGADEQRTDPGAPRASLPA